MLMLRGQQMNVAFWLWDGHGVPALLVIDHADSRMENGSEGKQSETTIHVLLFMKIFNIIFLSSIRSLLTFTHSSM